MNIFKEGRASFLDFLRNLTPQALVLSFAIIVGNNLENAKQTAIFFCLFAIWAVAAWANSSLFLEKYLISVKRIDRASKLFIRLGVTGFRNLYALLRYAWRKQRMIFVEMVVVFIVVEFGFVVVVLSATATATTLLKVFHA